MTIWTKGFLLALLERALKTFAQSFAALVGVDATSPANIHWLSDLEVAGVATLLSVLTSIAGNATTKNGPSFTDAEQVVPPEPQPK